MTSHVEEIKHKLDIVEVIQGYVKLQKAGASWKGLCPFHTEKTPSFVVSPEKQMWYCFGCSQGGDMFTFVEKIENVEFGDVLRLLADRAGVVLRPDDPEVRSKRKVLYEILERATRFFEHQLRKSTTGKKAGDYLIKERGLSGQTLSSWRLGYAPDSWSSLYDFLIKEGFSARDIQDSGLVVEQQKPRATVRKAHDRFRHRIMFPLFDVSGKVVGFSGRIFEGVPSRTTSEGAGKYINTPNTSLYDKSRFLYGLDRARVSLKEHPCVLVEGNLDVIAAHQAVTPNVVATCGTAIGEDHLRIIKRYTPGVLLAFDNDEAGERATKKTAHLALRTGLDVSVVAFNDAKDAAELLEKDASAWKSALESARPYAEFVYQRAVSTHARGELSGKRAIAREVLEAVREIRSPLERDYWIRELSGEIQISEEALRKEMELRDGREVGFSAVPEEATSPGFLGLQLSQLEEYFLALLVAWPRGRELLPEHLDFLGHEAVKEAAEELRSAKDPSAHLKRSARFASLVVAADFIVEIVPSLEEEFRKVLLYLQTRTLKEKLRAIEADLKTAEEAKNAKHIGILLREFHSLSKELLKYEKQKNEKK
jgi:DNA primase